MGLFRLLKTFKKLIIKVTISQNYIIKQSWKIRRWKCYLVNLSDCCDSNKILIYTSKIYPLLSSFIITISMQRVVWQCCIYLLYHDDTLTTQFLRSDNRQHYPERKTSSLFIVRFWKELDSSLHYRVHDEMNQIFSHRRS